MKVPFLDLSRQHAPLKAELMKVFETAVDGSGFIGGEPVSGFETEFAAYHGGGFCAGVNSGTDALRFALTALGVGAGDSVLTTAHTFIATTEAISQVGAKIRFVDVEEATGLMDVRKAGELMASEKIKAIIPVHLYGQCVDMDPLLQLAKLHGAKVLEDACQAHGASYKGRKAGTMGDAAAFSFYPGKNLGALGEGGAIISKDAGVIQTCKMLRDHGQKEKYVHVLEGYNGRLDTIQAGCLRVKLKNLDRWNAERVKQAQFYNEKLRDVPGVGFTETPSHNEGVFHLYVIYVDRPKELQKHLQDRGVGSGFHYPIPLHLQSCYAGLGYKEGSLPVTEKLSRRLLSLPVFPGLTQAEQEHVVISVREFQGSR